MGPASSQGGHVLSVAETEARELEALAARLEASGAYRVLRKLQPRTRIAAPDGGPTRMGLFVDVETTLSRLAALGLGGPPRRVTQSTPRGAITLATVRDPDGLLILLTTGSITRSA